MIIALRVTGIFLCENGFLPFSPSHPEFLTTEYFKLTEPQTGAPLLCPTYSLLKTTNPSLAWKQFKH